MIYLQRRSLPQLRQNIITGDWVVIAPERAKRPNEFVIPQSVKITDKSKCPFCPGSAGYKKNEKVHRANTENIIVIENKYPAFLENESKSQIRSYYVEGSFYRARPSVGDHEVVIIKNHSLSLMTFDKNIMTEMFQVIKQRYDYMKQEKGVVSIMPIYNHGAEAGASIDHPHAQIFASGIVANAVGKEMDGAERYYGVNGSCVFCDIISHEKKEKIRVILENEDFIATTAYSARFPMETWIFPKRHQSQFETVSNSELSSLAQILITIVRNLETNIPNVPLNWYIHTLPTTHTGSSSYHWHLEITPRLANYGGFELGSGIIIDIMSPEDSAEYLRKPEAGKGDQK